jgi:predicted anti-sigma-YlaC factor YlaD
MMTCRECAELLLEFLAGDLDAAQCERIRLHLQKCPPCVVYLETYQLTIHLTRQLTTCTQLPPEFAERLWKAMQHECGE